MLKQYKDLLRNRLESNDDFLEDVCLAVNPENNPFTHLSAIMQSINLSKHSKVAELERKNLIFALKDKIITYTINNNLKKASDIQAFDEKISSFISIHPTDVERILGCKTSERKRWVDEGLLVTGFVIDCKYGEVKYSTLSSVAYLKKNIDKIREQHDKQVAKNRSKAAQKASVKSVETRKKNAKYVNDKKTLLDSLKDGDKKDRLIYLSFLVQAASRYAKTDGEYDSDDFYMLKGEGIKYLLNVMRGKPGWLRGSIKETFYPSESPHRYNSRLCEHHFSLYRDSRETYDFSIPDFIEDNESELYRCSGCNFSTQKWYYSLYYLSVKIKDFKFGFHTPYSIGERLGFSDKSELETVEHSENTEGAYRFGKPMEELDMRVLTPEIVKSEIESFVSTVALD